MTATLLSEDADSVTIRVRRHVQPLRIPREALASMELSRGRGSRLPGAVVGLASGFVVGYVLAIPCGGASLCGGSGLAAKFGSALAVPGALLGLAVTPSERWELLPIVRRRGARLHVAPARGGVGWGLSIGF